MTKHFEALRDAVLSDPDLLGSYPVREAERELHAVRDQPGIWPLAMFQWFVELMRLQAWWNDPQAKKAMTLIERHLPTYANEASRHR